MFHSPTAETAEVPPTTVNHQPHSEESVDRIYTGLGIVGIPVNVDYEQLDLDRVPTEVITTGDDAVELQSQVEVDAEEPADTYPIEAVHETRVTRRHGAGRDKFTREIKVTASEIINRVLQESWREEELSDRAFERAFHSDRERAYTMRHYIAQRRDEVEHPEYHRGTLSVEEAISKVGLQPEVFQEVQEGLDRWNPHELESTSWRDQASIISGFAAGLQESLHPTPSDLERHRQLASTTRPVHTAPQKPMDECASCYEDVNQYLFR
jgi:hypothetical protein